MEHVCLFARKKSAHKKKDITKKEGVNQSVTKYDSIKNQGKCIDKNAFDIAIKVFVQKYMVLALKEIVSKTVIKTNRPRLEENVSQVCVYLSTNQTLTAFTFFHHLGLLSTRQKKHIK